MVKKLACPPLVKSGGASNDSTDTAPRAPTLHTFRGRLCCIAAELGRCLDYGREGRELVSMVRKRWPADMREGHDYEILTGDDWIAFQHLDGDPPSRSKAPSCMILYASGIDMACILTGKPIGVSMRRFLVKEVLPALRAGGPTLPAAGDVAALPALGAAPAVEPDPPPLTPDQIRGLSILSAADLILDLAEADVTSYHRLLDLNIQPPNQLQQNVHSTVIVICNLLLGLRSVSGIEERKKEIGERRERLSKACDGMV